MEEQQFGQALEALRAMQAFALHFSDTEYEFITLSQKHRLQGHPGVKTGEGLDLSYGYKYIKGFRLLSADRIDELADSHLTMADYLSRIINRGLKPVMALEVRSFNEHDLGSRLEAHTSFPGVAQDRHGIHIGDPEDTFLLSRGVSLPRAAVSPADGQPNHIVDRPETIYSQIETIGHIAYALSIIDRTPRSVS